MMEIVCSYCRCTYGWKDGAGTSHGICNHCKTIVDDDLRRGGNCDPDDIRAVADLRLPACQRQSRRM
jgi:hypothetical protein